MIDIHCHILHNIDDGARTAEISLNMVRQAYDAGVRTLVCTPHSPDSSASRHYSPALIRERTTALQQAADQAGIALTLLPGTEISFVPTVPQKLASKQILSLAGSRTVLIEMPVFAVDQRFLPVAQTLIADGYTVVLAHPERYIYNAQDLHDLQAIHEAGVLFQVTAIAVDEPHSLALFEHHLVDIVASDAHSDTYRPTAMRFAYDYVQERFGEAMAQQLFVDTPQKLISQ